MPLKPERVGSLSLTDMLLSKKCVRFMSDGSLNSSYNTCQLHDANYTSDEEFGMAITLVDKFMIMTSSGH